MAEMDSIYSSVGGAVEARGHTYFSEWCEFSYDIFFYSMFYNIYTVGLCMPIFNKKFRVVQRGASGRFLDLPITKSK